MMVRLWPNLAAAPMRTGGSYRGKTGHASLWWARRFMTHSRHERSKIAALKPNRWTPFRGQ
jgi:hypothetical protein